MTAGKGKPAIVTIYHSLLPGEGIAGTPLDEFVLWFIYARMCSSTRIPALFAGVCYDKVHNVNKQCKDMFVAACIHGELRGFVSK